MLKDNIRILRKSKGLSQEELAARLHVVRQTISKWEKDLSVPDAEMLVRIAKIFDVPVSTLLGEKIEQSKSDDLKIISEKLEVINAQLLERKTSRRKTVCFVLVGLCVVIALIFVALILFNSAYSNWDYDDPETAVLGTFMHSFEWIFVRVAPLIFALSLIGIILTQKRD